MKPKMRHHMAALAAAQAWRGMDADNKPCFGPGGFRMGPRDQGPGRGEGRGFGGHGRGPMGPGRFGGFGPMGPGGFGPMGPGGFGPGGPGGFGPGGFGLGGRGRARRGDVRLAIVALLAEQPMNGYQIIQALAEKTEGAWKPSPGAVYPALSQLTDEGLIVQTEVDGQKAFALTNTGRTEADAMTSKPWDAVNEANAPVDAEGAAAFWPEIGKLMMAAKTVGMSGSPAQVKAAIEAVQVARRKLYAILAEDDQPDA